jgi:hypothetical protein
MKVATSATVFSDAVGYRLSMTYSEIDEETGKIIADNKRIDRVITDKDAKANARAILDYAQEFVDGLEG